MKKLSVAMIVSQFPSILQTYIASTISGLQKNNAEITVIASNKPDSNSILPQNPDTPRDIIYINTDNLLATLRNIVQIPFFSIEYWITTKCLIKANIRKKYGWKYFIKSLVRMIAITKNKYDIIHSHNLTLSYDYLFIKEIYSTKLITTFHGKEPQGSKSLSKTKQKHLFEMGDLFLVNTQYARNSLMDLGCPEEKIQILPQGTNIKSFPFKKRSIEENNTINILTVGRLSKEKGQHIGLHAISILSSKYPTIKYHLVGDGPERQSLENLINELKIQNLTVLHGYAGSDELKAIYSKAHIFLLPSIDLKDDLHVETQGVVIQEAQSSGIPVIASRTGGIPEVIIDGQTGLLVKPNDPSELAKQIESLIINKKNYENICFYARQYVEEKFNIIDITYKLSLIYKRQLDKTLR